MLDGPKWATPWARRVTDKQANAVAHASIIPPVEPQFASFSELRRFKLADDVSAQALFGEGAMLSLVELEPNAVVPAHSHTHEQLGVVLRGELNLVVAGDARAMAEMDAYALPGGLEHQAQAGPQGALVLDVFQPVREDYRDAASAT